MPNNMIRPTSLHRGDEDPVIEAPARNINHESLDCGITAMQCCQSHGCQKLATSRNFVIVLSLIGLMQGAIERYFQLSVAQAAAQFDYDPLIVEWLLFTHGLAQGALAILITYWGNRIHRISWLGSLLMLQSLAAIAIIIPIVTNNNAQNQSISAPIVNPLCTERTIESLEDEPTYADTTLAMMFVLQVVIGAARVVFYTLGLSYVDDNVREHHSPALLGTILACSLWGSQFGTALGHLVVATPFGWWLGWTVLAPLFFLLAALLSLFPRRLVKSVVRQAADNIVQEASSSQMSLAGLGQPAHSPPPLLADISFKRSMRRMLTNRVLMCNVLASTFVLTAVINYAHHETDYLRARFLLPSVEAGEDALAWPSRLWTQLVRPLMVAIAVLLAGLVIAKSRPSARKLAAWSAIMGAVALALFVGYVFIDCDRSPVAGGYGDKLTKPYCSRSCLCDEDIRFTPVCPMDSQQTYFSACHAGCADVAEVNAVRIYTNCTCGPSADEVLLNAEGVATEGACGADACQPLWIVYQVLTVVGASAVASAWVGRVLVSVRSVLRQDRALALGVELTLVGLVAYGPGHAGYQAIADITCQYWSHSPGTADAVTTCQLHSAQSFPNTLNIVSAILILIAIFFDVLVLAFAGNVQLYGDVDEVETAGREMLLMSRVARPEQDEAAQPFIARSAETARPNGTSPSAASVSPNTNVIRFQFNGTPPLPSTSLSERMRQSIQQQPPSQSPSPNASAASTSITYARVHRSSQPAPAAEELNFRLQRQHQQPASPTAAFATGNAPDSNVRPSELLMRRTAAAGGDINPSRGNRFEPEPEVDIAQIERSLSSIGGDSPGPGSPGMGMHRSRSRTETDF